MKREQESERTVDDYIWIYCENDDELYAIVELAKEAGRTHGVLEHGEWKTAKFIDYNDVYCTVWAYTCPRENAMTGKRCYIGNAIEVAKEALATRRPPYNPDDWEI